MDLCGTGPATKWPVTIHDSFHASRTMQNDRTLAIPFPARYRPKPMAYLGIRRTVILGCAVLATAACFADGASAASPGTDQTPSVSSHAARPSPLPPIPTPPLLATIISS